MSLSAHSSLVRARAARARFQAAPPRPAPPPLRPAVVPPRRPAPAPRAQLSTLVGIAPVGPIAAGAPRPSVPSTSASAGRALSAMDEAFLHARMAEHVAASEALEAPVNRKQSLAARQRRAHLRKYVLAVTSFCALVLVSGLARMFLDGLVR